MSEPVFDFINPNGRPDILLICDHAGNELPPDYQDQVDEGLLHHHFAYDIGIAGVARHLSSLLDAPAFMGRYSRLLVDLNRPAGTDLLFPDIGEGHPIAMNQGLTQAEKQKRIERYFNPYHAGITAHLEGVMGQGHVPIVISLHSFTPEFHGETRPWHFGVTWIQDENLPDLMIEGLRDKGFCVGEHQPYDCRMLRDMSLERHADGNNLPNLFLETRNDQILLESGQHHVAEIFAGVIGGFLGRQDIHRLYEGERLPRDIAAETLYIQSHMRTRTNYEGEEA